LYSIVAEFMVEAIICLDTLDVWRHLKIEPLIEILAPAMAAMCFDNALEMRDTLMKPRNGCDRNKHGMHQII